MELEQEGQVTISNTFAILEKFLYQITGSCH